MSQIFEFGPFRLDPVNRRLLREGEVVVLSGKAFDILLLLVQRAGQLVSKDELMAAVWGDAFVEEANITVAVSTLRKALGEDPQTRRYIQTVSKHGYRFVSPVQVIAPVAETAAPIPSHIISPTIHPSSIHALATAIVPQRRWWRSHLWKICVTASVVILIVMSIDIRSRLHGQHVAIQSLAVLPFHDLSAEPASDYLGLGVTDSLITNIGNQGAVAVRPTSSVLKYFNGAVDPLAAGREQNVDAVLTGSLRSDEHDVTAQARLLRVHDGVELWHGSFHATPDSVVSLEDQMESAVSAALGAPPNGTAANASSTPASATHAVNPEAHQLYLRGRYFWNRRTEEGLEHSIDYFQQAIAADPNYAPAYAGLADSYALMASFSIEPGRKANPDARSAALTAIHLDPKLAEPHASLGMLSFFTGWDGAAAEQEFRRAIALNPNYETAHHWYALDLAAMGRFPEALYEIRRAQELDPVSLIISTNVGWILYLDHRYDEAITQYKKVLELDPNFVRAHTRLGTAEMQKGDYPAALQDLTEAARLSGQDPYVVGLLGEAQGLSGDKAAATQTLAQLRTRAKTQYVPPFAPALVELGMGQTDAAIADLQKAAEDHSTPMVYAKIDPSLDALRGNPQFQAIIHQMKF